MTERKQWRPSRALWSAQADAACVAYFALTSAARYAVLDGQREEARRYARNARLVLNAFGEYGV